MNSTTKEGETNMKGMQRVAGMIGSIVMGLTMVMTNTVGIYQTPLKVKAANESVAIENKQVHSTVAKDKNRNLANVALGKASGIYWADGTPQSEKPYHEIGLATDGVNDNTYNYTEFGADHTTASSYLEIDLKQEYSLDSINMWRFWEDGRTYSATVIAIAKDRSFNNADIVYNSDSNNIHGFGAGTDALYKESSMGKSFDANGSKARYIRVYMSGSTSNNPNHIVEVEANVEYKALTNLALNSKTGIYQTKGDVQLNEHHIFPSSTAVDGEKRDGSNNYAEFGSDYDNESRYLQITLDRVFSIYTLNMWRYWQDGRTYNGTVIALSETADFADYKVIYNSDAANIHGFGAGADALYEETALGMNFQFEKTSARYIRVYMCGSSAHNTNHIVEIEVEGVELGEIAEVKPTAVPTTAPTVEPTTVPTATPTTEPTKVPTEAPTAEPTKVPTEAPTATPTVEPTKAPTEAPTETPTTEPTKVPTEAPTATPTPTAEPTKVPTEAPTATPTVEPIKVPTQAPTATPTQAPTTVPTQAATKAPAQTETKAPTHAPTKVPTQTATKAPTHAPTKVPTQTATKAPTKAPAQTATKAPAQTATKAPAQTATKAPTQTATQAPTHAPTKVPTQTATKAPTKAPAQEPTKSPTKTTVQVHSTITIVNGEHATTSANTISESNSSVEQYNAESSQVQSNNDSVSDANGSTFTSENDVNKSNDSQNGAGKTMADKKTINQNTVSKNTERAIWSMIALLVVVLVSGIYLTTKSNTNNNTVDDNK